MCPNEYAISRVPSIIVEGGGAGRSAIVLFCRKKRIYMYMYIHICMHTYFFISFSSRSPAGINETRVIIVLGRERWTSGPLSTAQVDTAHCGGGDAYAQRQGRESFFRRASVPREIYFASVPPPNDMEMFVDRTFDESN